MRVYHFLNAKYGLENLRNKRLKIATLLELNDPFEFFGVCLADASIRRAFKAMKTELAKTRGLLCFSRSWHNPVQWSHYAEKHRGICLGFDVPEEKVEPVCYSGTRVTAEIEELAAPRTLDHRRLMALMFTKYSHWRYENEVRGFVTLEDRDPATGLFFAGFSDLLNLKEVIVGAESTISRAFIDDALGDLAASVLVRKARIAFRSFKIVQQRDERLWA